MEKAILLTEPIELSEAGKLSRVLDFFGVSADRLSVAEFLTSRDDGNSDSKFRLLCTSGAFLKLQTALESKADGVRFWQRNVHSAFVYAAGNFPAVGEIAAKITN